MGADRASRCEAVVYKRDTYRVSRGNGFKMHYEAKRCERLAKAGGLCAQHAKLAELGVFVARRPEWS